MPTFGRTRGLIENAIECFLRQDYPDGHLLVWCDDGRRLPVSTDQQHDRVHIFSTPTRCPSLPDKYDAMVTHALAWWRSEAFALWDDDDVYLPWHLSAHARVLQDHQWSKPSQVWSTYTGRPELESGAGRFHGSIAMRTDALASVGGWIGVMPPGQPLRADFDQRMIGALGRMESPGDPCEIAMPSYVFRWGDTGAQHCQGRMKAPDDTTWYTEAVPQCVEPIGRIIPRLDDSAEGIYRDMESRVRK